MDTSTPTNTRREVQLITLDDESPIKWGVLKADGGNVDHEKSGKSDTTTDNSGEGNSQMISVRAGISNELDSTALSQYIEPSPDTMDRRLAGAAKDIAVGAKIKQIVPELADETVPESPIGQNFYRKIMKEKVSKAVCVEVKKLKLGLNAPLDILRASAVEGGSGKKRPIPMETDMDSLASPLKKTRQDIALL